MSTIVDVRRLKVNIRVLFIMKVQTKQHQTIALL